MKHTLMKDTFRTLCLALTVGMLAGAGTATYVLEVDAHGKVGLDFDAANGRQNMEPGHLDAGDATGRPPKFWGLKVGTGDSLTAIGVYSGRTATGARYVAPAYAVKLSPQLPE